MWYHVDSRRTANLVTVLFTVLYVYGVNHGTRLAKGHGEQFIVARGRGQTLPLPFATGCLSLLAQIAAFGPGLRIHGERLSKDG